MGIGSVVKFYLADAVRLVKGRASKQIRTLDLVRSRAHYVPAKFPFLWKAAPYY